MRSLQAEAASMSWYRFHLFGQLPTARQVYDHLCANDAQALLAALDLLGTWPLVEVWQHGRLVCRVPSPAAVSAPPFSGDPVRPAPHSDGERA
jgi:hypothetical protein